MVVVVDPAAGAGSSPGPTWTILVATLGERRHLFGRLLDVLLPQTEPYGGAVRVLAWWNNGDPPLPVLRQRMVESVTSDYLCWVDDDDLVPDGYVAEVAAALASRPDYVGFRVQCFSSGKPWLVAHHSLAHGGWYAKRHRLYRDLSHINPIRADLARLADFSVVGAGEPEDRAWVAQLRATGKVRTEVLIDKIMYHYLYMPGATAGVGSRWRAPERITPDLERLPVEHPHFAYWDGDGAGAGG